MSGNIYIYDLKRDGAEFFIRRQFSADVGADEAKRMADRSAGRFLVVWDFDHFGRKAGEPFYCFNENSMSVLVRKIFYTCEHKMLGPTIAIAHRVASDALSEAIELIDALKELSDENARTFTASAINDD